MGTQLASEGKQRCQPFGVAVPRRHGRTVVCCRRYREGFWGRVSARFCNGLRCSSAPTAQFSTFPETHGWQAAASRLLPTMGLNPARFHLANGSRAGVTKTVEPKISPCKNPQHTIRGGATTPRPCQAGWSAPLPFLLVNDVCARVATSLKPLSAMRVIPAPSVV
ncbi:hypothetical protein APED_29985 [Acanthopleuribacter pedis]